MKKSEMLNIRTEDLHPNIKRLIKLIGVESAMKLVEHYGGEHVYIPKKDHIERAIRNIKITKEFKGDNHKELGKKYGLTSTMIRNIVRRPQTNSSTGKIDDK